MGWRVPTSDAAKVRPVDADQVRLGRFDLAVGDLHCVPLTRTGGDGRERDICPCVPAADRWPEDPAAGLVPQHLDAGSVRLNLVVNRLQCACADVHGQAAGRCMESHRKVRTLDRANAPRTYDRRSGCCCTSPRRDVGRARGVLVVAEELLDVAGRGVDRPFQPTLLATSNKTSPLGPAAHSRKRCVCGQLTAAASVPGRSLHRWQTRPGRTPVAQPATGSRAARHAYGCSVWRCRTCRPTRGTREGARRASTPKKAGPKPRRKNRVPQVT